MPTRKLSESEERQTVLSLVLGVTIWFLHLNTLNMLTSLACKWGWFPFEVMGMPGLQFVEMLISITVLLIMLLMVYLPWRYWRSFQTKDPIQNPNLLADTENDRRPLVAFVAMLMNGIFSLFVLASFVLPFALHSCGMH